MTGSRWPGLNLSSDQSGTGGGGGGKGGARSPGGDRGRPQTGVVIEKGIPLPSRQVARKYPFDEMEVGDSFFVTDVSVVLLHAHARRHSPRRFTCRTVVEGDIKGVRVWRIE